MNVDINADISMLQEKKIKFNEWPVWRYYSTQNTRLISSFDYPSYLFNGIAWLFILQKVSNDNIIVFNYSLAYI